MAQMGGGAPPMSEGQESIARFSRQRRKVITSHFLGLAQEIKTLAECGASLMGQLEHVSWHGWMRHARFTGGSKIFECVTCMMGSL